MLKQVHNILYIKPANCHVFLHFISMYQISKLFLLLHNIFTAKKTEETKSNNEDQDQTALIMLIPDSPDKVHRYCIYLKM